MKSFNLSEWAVHHRSFVLFLLIGTLIAGVFSFNKLGRLEDPPFSVPSMTAIVVWPGATAQEVQDQVLNRLEKKLEQIEHFDSVKSFARQGYGALTLNVRGGTPKAAQQEAWYQARKKMSDVRPELPAGVIGPQVNDEYGDVYSLIYALKSDGIALAELNAYAEQVKRTLLRVPGVKKVDVLGKQPQRIFVEFSHARLAALGIPFPAVADSLQRQNAVVTAGAVDTRADRVFVRVDGKLGTVDDVRAVPIEAGGRLLRLGDIAQVRAGYEDPPAYTVRHNGAPVLALGISMPDDGNMLELGRELGKAMAGIERTLPYGIEIERIADQPTIVEASVWEFERAFLEALAIVLAVSFLSLGWRTGIVVAASVPLVLGIVAVVMYAGGWNLDRITLGSLIIALGLLVDDAIISVEMMVGKMEQGLDRMRAATFAYTSTAFPMLTGTLITVAGFMPVGFAKSVAGEYAGGIFWIVGTALISSWIVAVIFTPYLGIKLLPKDLAARAHGNPYDKPLYRRLRGRIERAVARRWTVIGVTVAALLAAGAGMTLVQQQFFPTASRFELLVELRLREGASFEATTTEVKRLEALLARDPEIEYFTAYTGAGAPRFYLSLAPEQPNPSYAQFVVMTAGVEARERVRARLLELFARNEAFPQVRGRVSRLEFGPPTGFPVQFRVIGPDALEVRRIARDVEAEVARSPLVRDVQLDWNDPVRALRVKVDQDKARLLGLTPADIALTVQTVMSGVTVSQLRDGEELIDIVARAVPGERRQLDTLEDINLFTRSGAAVPLSQVARVSHELEEPVLWRRNRDMAITVRADVADGIQGVYATSQIRPALKRIEAALPPGYRIENGGAIEESAKANQALYAVFPLMFLVMLLFLMMQLQSFSKMAMVFLTAPLGLIGVVPALLLFNAPFGFVALLGVIALAGMIMRNSVILVDQIDHDIAAGSSSWEAVVDATVRRTRPVLLTAAAAVLAMIPLTKSVFWGPMAIAIMGGLTVATALTLFFVPALYAAWFRVGRSVPAAEPSPKGQEPVAIAAS